MGFGGLDLVLGIELGKRGGYRRVQEELVEAGYFLAVVLASAVEVEYLHGLDRVCRVCVCVCVRACVWVGEWAPDYERAPVP